MSGIHSDCEIVCTHGFRTWGPRSVKYAMVAGLCSLGLLLAAPAQASGSASAPRTLPVQLGNIGDGSMLLRTATPKMLALVASDTDFALILGGVSAQNQCIAYSYDKNGNRTSQSNQGFGATGTWGSSTFGCFNWTAP